MTSDSTTHVTAERRAGNETARDHLANERTLLAWTRTGIAVMALGFVVARFGLVLRGFRPAVPSTATLGVSTAFGTALVVAGGVVVALAVVQYMRVGRAIDLREYRWSPRLGLALSVLMTVVALLLAVYLLATG